MTGITLGELYWMVDNMLSKETIRMHLKDSRDTIADKLENITLQEKIRINGLVKFNHYAILIRELNQKYGIQ